MSLTVKFWGTRGSIPTPGQGTHGFGGNTSCVEIRAGETVFVCDAGTGARELGLDLIARDEGPLVLHFLFSHTHWDHIQGFPFFVPAYDPRNTLRIYGANDGDDGFFRLLSGQMEFSYFPVTFADLGATIVADSLKGGDRTIDGARVRCFGQTHPGGSLAYRIEHEGRTVVYATDHELDQDIPESHDVEANPDALRPVRPDFVTFVKSADLLIVDSQYTDDEYLAKVGWGHPRATTALDLAVSAGVKQLALFHHDPMHTDSDVERIVEECRARALSHGVELEVFGAREGLELEV